MKYKSNSRLSIICFSFLYLWYFEETLLQEISWIYGLRLRSKKCNFWSLKIRGWEQEKYGNQIQEGFFLYPQWSVQNILLMLYVRIVTKVIIVLIATIFWYKYTSIMTDFILRLTVRHFRFIRTYIRNSFYLLKVKKKKYIKLFEYFITLIQSNLFESMDEVVYKNILKHQYDLNLKPL